MDITGLLFCIFLANAYPEMLYGLLLFSEPLHDLLKFRMEGFASVLCFALLDASGKNQQVKALSTLKLGHSASALSASSSSEVQAGVKLTLGFLACVSSGRPWGVGEI